MPSSSSPPSSSGSTLVPCLRYRDARAAIAWICEVMGFREHLVVPGEGQEIMHAELVSGSGMLMLGSIRDSDYNRLFPEARAAEPGKALPPHTTGLYLVVPDADAVYARVQKSGCAIERPIVDEPYGGRGFTCRDPEGHVWSVGSYDPWLPPVQV